jgi:hypothetical protein
VFIYTSFSQVDNLRDVDGTVVEEPDGLIKSQYRNVSPFAPELSIFKSTRTQGQEVFIAPGSAGVPTGSKQLFYVNTDAFNHGVTGPVAVRRRLHEISSEIRTVNRAAQSTIRSYNKDSVWQYYKLVNVQAATLPSFVDRSEADNLCEDHKASFFMANEVVETNVPLQQFSGTGSDPGNMGPFAHAGNYDYGLIAKTGQYQADKPIRFEIKVGEPVDNVYLRRGAPKGQAWRSLNMGGCVGCHGPQGQLVGGDFSVILARGRVMDPDTVDGKSEKSIVLYERNLGRIDRRSR